MDISSIFTVKHMMKIYVERYSFVMFFCDKVSKFAGCGKNSVEGLAAEAVAQRCSVKKVFLGISQNSQENTCARISFLIKLQASGLRLSTLLKKRFWHWCFPVNFAKFLRLPFLTEHLHWLLLWMAYPEPTMAFTRYGQC